MLFSHFSQALNRTDVQIGFKDGNLQVKFNWILINILQITHQSVSGRCGFKNMDLRYSYTFYM